MIAPVFRRKRGEAKAHTAPGFGIDWTSSMKYIPYLFSSIEPIELNRAVGLKIEDASEIFHGASSILNLQSDSSIEFNRVN